MANTPSPTEAAAHLELLDNAKSSVDIGEALDLGPLWYAPLFATMLACVTLFGQPEAGDWSFAYAIVGIASGAIISIHDYRRRQVRLRPSVRSFMIMLPIVLGSFAVIAVWGTAVSTIGYERFVPGYAVVGWLLTAGFMLGLRALLNEANSRRDTIT